MKLFVADNIGMNDWPGGLTQISDDIEHHGYDNIKLGDSWLAEVAWVGIYLPVLLEWETTAKQDTAEDGEPCYDDERKANVDAGSVAQQVGRQSDVKRAHAQFQQPTCHRIVSYPEAICSPMAHLRGNLGSDHTIGEVCRCTSPQFGSWILQCW